MNKRKYIGIIYAVVISVIFIMNAIAGMQILSGVMWYGFSSVQRVVFGLLHVVTGWDTWTFLSTGAIGFAFAVIYLVSHNLLIPMVLHAAYDVAANLAAYGEWRASSLFVSLNGTYFYMVVGVMFLVSLFVLIFKPENVDENA